MNHPIPLVCVGVTAGNVPTLIVTLAMSVPATPPGLVSVYQKTSVPSKPAAGLYTNVPSELSTTEPPLVVVTVPPGAVLLAVPCTSPNPVRVPPFNTSLHVTLCSGLAPQLAPMAELVSVRLPTDS